MLKFIRGKGNQPTAERLKIQKELFGFTKAVRHGFPHKPTSMAWDPELKLLAIGTKQGLLRVYGRPGVEYYGQHENEKSVTHMVFVPGQGRVVALTDDNYLHLWEINGTEIHEKRSTNMEGRLKRVSVLCMDAANKKILLGTEGGNIYQLNLVNFKIEENIIYQDLVMENSPEDFKVNPGAVEALVLHPTEGSKILIGYARGLIAIWDRATSTAVQTYTANQQLEALSWRSDGSEFVSAHNDGSYIIWSTTGTDPLEPPNTPYGPYPCKAITKIHWAHDSGTTWTLFSGGMPRASYGDKFTVTVMKGDDRHSVFDLSSKVIDFLVINEAGLPSSLMVLSEEELVAVDLTADHWPVYNMPYLNPIHASSITCITHVPNVEASIYDKIVEAGKSQLGTKVSTKEWPVDGGVVPEASNNNKRDVLITGHEDGSVKFWSCASVALAPLFSLKTGKFFLGDDLDESRDEEEEEEEDEWPPFRKLGHFDPYSDDPRLAVKKVAFCGRAGTLVVGGTAGQVVLCTLEESDTEAELNVIKSDLVTEKEGFTWKGHNALVARVGSIKMSQGFQPSCVVQITPPASINSLGFSTEWGLVAAGTAHGLVILDSVQLVTVTAKCTLNAQDIANADDNPMSRRKSLKKSLRESFRRLRKGRSQRNVDKKKPGTTTTAADPIKKELPRSESPESRPVERSVEARSGSEDGLGSMVRCLHFANTYIANPQTLSATMWAGTNSGQILVFLLTIPAKGEKRKEVKVTAMLGKEIQLKHKAPVIGVQVLDASSLPLPVKFQDETPTPHRVLITSEEQFKLFMLPTLKPCGKYKLTAHEGSRARKIGFTTFVSASDKDYAENCFTCLTNQGDLAIHSLPELRRQVLQTQCMRKEDVIAISTLVFTPQGEAFYLSASSELTRVSVAAALHLKAKGTLVIDANVRHELENPKASKSILTKEDKEKKTTAAADSDETAAQKKPKSTTFKKDVPGDTDSVVARQNQLNERQAQGTKSPVTNGDQAAATTPNDPHNDTTVSEISADITLDSVKDHTLAQQQLEASMNATRISTDTSTSSLTVTKAVSSSATQAEKVEEETENKESNNVNGQSEVMNGLTNESLESPPPTIIESVPEHKVQNETLKATENKNEQNESMETEQISDEQDETLKPNLEEKDSFNKTVENTLTEEFVEKVTSVDDDEEEEENGDEITDVAPLASLESDPAPLASLESTTEFQSI